MTVAKNSLLLLANFSVYWVSPQPRSAMMNHTPNAVRFLLILDKQGASPYAVTRGLPDTSKIARRMLRNAVPIVLQVNCKKPIIWLLPDQERGAFRLLGQTEPYSADRGKHHHLRQIRDFQNRDLIKISIQELQWPEIEEATKNLSA